MNTINNFAPLVCASEMSLTVALVVFVMLTALLTAIIILLCASKSFRAFFFREHKNAEPEKSANEQPAKTVPAEPATAPLRSVPTDEPANKKPAHRKKRDDIFGGVPTVPLTLFPADAAPPEKRVQASTKRKNSMGDGINTVEIPTISAPAERTVYTPRTIGRNRTEKQPTEKSDAQKKKHTPKNK